MIPIRVRRGAAADDVFVDIAGRTVGEIATRLGAENLVVDGSVVAGNTEAGDVLRPGSELGGLAAPGRPVLWELGVAAGPGSGHRYLLGPGRYPIGRPEAAAITFGGVPHGNLTLVVGDEGWSMTGIGVEQFEARDMTLLKVGSSWVTLRRHTELPTRRPGRVNRPPRVLPGEANRCVPVPEALDLSHRRREMRWAMFVGPLLIGGMMAVFFQPLFALFALLGPVMATAGWVEDEVRIRRSRVAQAAADLARLRSYEEDLSRAGRHAEEFERRRLGILDAVRIAVHADSRLWERRNDHPDAGSVVIGYGSAPLSPSPAADDEALQQAATSAVLRGVPIAVDLAPGRVLALVDRRGRSRLAAGIVAQAVTWRGPCDLRVAIVSDRPEIWDWTKWLPHVESDPLAGTRLLAADRSDAESVVQYCRDTDENVLMVVDVADPVSLGLHDVLASPHVAAIVSVPDRASIPGSATQVVDGGVLSDAWSPLRVRFDEIVPDEEALDTIARALAASQDPERRIVGSAIPSSVALRALDPECVDSAGIRARWGVPPDGLRFTIGMGESGPLVLDLVADGPHALVAGTTGSGKSELLRTVVASLAATYSPDDVNFVLVDYKGGSAFDACARLPHVAGLVTDLDNRLAERAKVALEAELRRREHILRSHNAEDVRHYRRLGGDGLPRLVIVVDEFAALASDVPSFMDAVIDFAQRGRSLGVHLVLATQRPAGVVSEPIRANTNMRVSLRVQSEHDAHDVVNDPAPAALPRHLPGRAYARTGPGELRMFQTASVTSGADGSELMAVPFRFGISPVPGPAPGGVRDLDSIVDAIVWAGEGHPEPFRPWRPPLPDRVEIGEIETAGIGLGLEDQPARQSRTVWEWDPSINLALVGTPQSGASKVLESIVARAAATAAGDDVGFYVIAGGGSTWPTAGSIAAIGDVVLTSQVSRLQRLISTLWDEIESRRTAPWSSRVVVAVDGVEAVLRALEREHASREAFIALAANGPAVGVTMVMVANRIGALPTSMSAAVEQRLLFQLADPFEYSAVGLKADQHPAPMRGRCVDPRIGHEIQMAICELGDVDPRPRDRFLPAIEELPLVCKVTEVATRLDLAGDDWFLPVGIGDLSLSPTGWTLGPGEHALVVGSARSGKSTLLRGLASLLKGNRVSVVVVASRRSPLHDAADLEVHGEMSEDLKGALTDRSVVLVDDAFRISPDGFQSLLAARTDARIVATARPEDIRNGYSHWTKALRDLRTGALLGPTNAGVGELLGAALPRHLPLPHPGRGFIVVDGGVELCQTICA